MNEYVTTLIKTISDALASFAADIGLISDINDRLDVDLSTRASEATLATLGTEATLASVLSQVSAGTWTPATAAAANYEGVISAAPTNARSIIASNSDATTLVYLQLFDSATVPLDGVAPRIPSIPIDAGQTVVIDLGRMAFANGLSWASSSTVDTKTATTLITPLQVSAELAA